VLDAGHTGKLLDDFVQHPTAAAAGLKRIHVLALRLYTTSMHHSINEPLREGCSPAKPHPYPSLVTWLCDALLRLRQQEAEAARAEELAKARRSTHSAPTDTSDEKSTRTMWRGVDALSVDEAFEFSELRSRGGTELGFMSASSSRAVAEEYANRAPDHENGPLPLVLKVRADVQNGSDLSFLSVFPNEFDCVYPPGTYLEPRSGYEEPVVLPTGEELNVRIFEVVPRVSVHFQV